MIMSPKIRKDQVVCPNPLFLIWLEEKQEPEECNLNSRYTYGRAIVSVKHYPLSISSGKEAVILILENIREYTAHKLDLPYALLGKDEGGTG